MNMPSRFIIPFVILMISATSTTAVAAAHPRAALAPQAAAAAAGSAQVASGTGSFYNPIADAEDPSIVTDGGYYYLLGTNNSTNTLSIRKSSTLAGLNSAPLTPAWTGPSSGLGSSRLWSPVLEKVQGTWYIYLSVTDDANPVAHAAVYALQGNSTNPLGPYTLKAAVKSWSTVDGGAWERGIVGPAVTAMPDGSLYLTTTTFGFFIQKMSDPWTLQSASSMVSINDGSPTYSWEGGTSEVSRPIVHTVAGSTKVFMPYTSENHVTALTNGGPCWSFCVGMFTNTDGNLTNPASWVKSSQPVFAGNPTNGQFRILALGVFSSPDGSEDWLVYNGNDTAGTNFTQRYTFVQPFTWTAGNTPSFGSPTPVGTAITTPSGETGSPAPLTPGATPVSSNFDDGSTSAWTPLTGTWAACTTGQYCATGTGDNLTSAGTSNLDNYTVQAKVTPDNAPNGSGVDIIGRLQSSSKFYELELLKDAGGTRKWVIAENRSGTYSVLASGAYSWSAGSSYWLRFDLNAANLTALISTDGQRFTQLGTIRLTEIFLAGDFPDYGWGKAALRTWGGLTAHFDDVSVTNDRTSMGFYTGPGWPGIVLDAGDSQEANKDFCVQQYNEYCSGGHQSSTTAVIDTSGVIDPLPAAAYQTERWNDAAPATRLNDGSFHYIIPSLTPGQTYRVRLHFAEIYYSAVAQRVFNVSLNGTQVLTNFDKLAAAGARNKAVVREFNIAANGVGDIDVAFTPGTGTVPDHNPTVSAIEVLPDTIAINAGGPAQSTFAADRGYQGGAVLTTTTAVSTSGVANAGPASIYQSERYNFGSPGDFHYLLTNLSPGKQYTVRLHFAEIYYSAVGQRAFNVSINNTAVLTNFDKVLAAGGAFKAAVRSFTAAASSSGQIDLHFTQGTQAGADHNPTVSAVELVN